MEHKSTTPAAQPVQPAPYAAGTCMQCGCYVEMRAARTDMHCPLDNAPW